MVVALLIVGGFLFYKFRKRPAEPKFYPDTTNPYDNGNQIYDELNDLTPTSGSQRSVHNSPPSCSYVLAHSFKIVIGYFRLVIPVVFPLYCVTIVNVDKEMAYIFNLQRCAIC